MILENCRTGLLTPGKPAIRSVASITRCGFTPHHGCFPQPENLCRQSTSYGQILGQTSVIQKLAKEQLLLAIPSSVTPPRDKNCGLSFNADGVEMEGAAVAQICSQYGTPLLVIRSITDALTAPRTRTITVSFGSLLRFFCVRNRHTQPIAKPWILSY